MLVWAFLAGEARRNRTAGVGSGSIMRWFGRVALWRIQAPTLTVRWSGLEVLPRMLIVARGPAEGPSQALRT